LHSTGIVEIFCPVAIAPSTSTQEEFTQVSHEEPEAFQLNM